MNAKRMRAHWIATVVALLAAGAAALGHNLVWMLGLLILAVWNLSLAERYHGLVQLEVDAAMRRHPAGKALGR